MNKIAVICGKRSFFNMWMKMGQLNGIDRGKFLFVSRPEHVLGYELSHIISIGEYFPQQHDCFRVSRTRLR